MKVNNYLHDKHFLNHGIEGLKDFKDLKSMKSKNPCHLRNPRKSVIQTTMAKNYKGWTI